MPRNRRPNCHLPTLNQLLLLASLSAALDLRRLAVKRPIPAAAAAAAAAGVLPVAPLPLGESPPIPPSDDGVSWTLPPLALPLPPAVCASQQSGHALNLLPCTPGSQQPLGPLSRP